MLQELGPGRYARTRFPTRWESKLLPSENTLFGDRYRFVGLLGRGGMGAVFEVVDEGSNEHLALKLLSKAASPAVRALFEREFRTLAGLRHPRIVQVFDYGVDEAGPFYTMELLRGADLSRRAPMPWREACACLRDAASALGVLHARQLVHRDLSPRNLWHTPDGRLKLLDFGALCPFGKAPQVVGTPALIAPETLASEALDQRTDLFGLGALGHWLLTGAPAYRATHLADLQAAWTRTPAKPSTLLPKQENADASIPEALDRLIGTLLQLAPQDRPRTTADVIDGLTEIADLPPEAADVIAQGYLDSSAFVGRKRALRRTAKLLGKAMEAAPQALCIEGPEGIGRSRLLVEMGMLAQQRGATVVRVAAVARDKAYGVAASSVVALSRAFPREATIERLISSSTIALPPHLLAALGTAPSRLVQDDRVEARVNALSVLSQWVLDLSERHTLAILVDDFHEVDEESAALLATLARASVGHRLFLIAAVRIGSQDGTDNEPARMFLGVARKLRVPALTASELTSMLRSIFGEVPYLGPTALRLHGISKGVPKFSLELVKHLVQSGAAEYAQGAWCLPTELPAGLPDTLLDSTLASLGKLANASRRLLALIALAEPGGVTREMLAAMAQTEGPALAACLAPLLDLHVVRESEEGLRIESPKLSATMRARLPDVETQEASRRLAAVLARHPDALSQVRCGLHLLRARDFEAGGAHLLFVARSVMKGETDYLRPAAPLFAEALQVMRGAGRSAYEQLPLLAVLAVAGYQVSRSYAVQYGDEALAALQEALHFPLAERLRRRIFGLPALLVAMLATTISLRRTRSPLGTIELVAWLVTATGYLMGPATLCFDGVTLRRYARVLEPLKGLGSNHVASLIQRQAIALALTTEERPAAAVRAMRGLIDRLEDEKPIGSLPDSNRRAALGAAYYSCGVRETFACDTHALTLADQLAPLSSMHEMQADRTRAFYYRHRGDLDTAAQYDRKVEEKAISLGSAWQAEIPLALTKLRTSAWTLDVAEHQRASAMLARLAVDIPPFRVHARRAIGVNLALRGRYEEAVARLEPEVDDDPLADSGWCFLRGVLAMCHNQLGQHERRARFVSTPFVCSSRRTSASSC